MKLNIKLYLQKLFPREMGSISQIYYDFQLKKSIGNPMKKSFQTQSTTSKSPPKHDPSSAQPTFPNQDFFINLENRPQSNFVTFHTLRLALF